MSFLPPRLRFIATAWMLVMAILASPLQTVAALPASGGCGSDCPCEQSRADENDPCDHDEAETHQAADDHEEHAATEDDDCTSDCADCDCDSGIVVGVVGSGTEGLFVPFPTARDVAPPDPLAVGPSSDIFVPPRS